MAVHRLNKYAKMGITGLSIGLCCTCPKIRPQREAFFPSQKRRPCGQSARFVDGSPWIPQRPGVRNPERNATKRGFPQNPRLYYDYVYSLYPTPPLPARLPQRTKGRICAARAGQKSFMDCLIFFNRLLILSLLSKPAVCVRYWCGKRKGLSQEERHLSLSGSAAAHFISGLCVRENLRFIFSSLEQGSSVCDRSHITLSSGR